MEGGLSIEGMEEHIAQLLTCKPLSEAQVKNLCEKVRENSHSLCHPRPPRVHPHSRVMLGERAASAGGARTWYCAAAPDPWLPRRPWASGGEGATRALLSGWWWWLGLVWGAKATR